MDSSALFDELSQLRRELGALLEQLDVGRSEHRLYPVGLIRESIARLEAVADAEARYREIAAARLKREIPDDASLSAIEADLAALHDQRLASIRDLLALFAKLRSDNPHADAALGSWQTRLAALDDDELLALDEEQDLEPLRLFCELALCEDSVRIGRESQKLNQHIDVWLIVALAQKSIYPTETAEEAAADIEAPQTAEKKTTPGSEPAPAPEERAETAEAAVEAEVTTENAEADAAAAEKAAPPTPDRRGRRTRKRESAPDTKKSTPTKDPEELKSYIQELAQQGDQIAFRPYGLPVPCPPFHEGGRRRYKLKTVIRSSVSHYISTYGDGSAGPAAAGEQEAAGEVPATASATPESPVAAETPPEPETGEPPLSPADDPVPATDSPAVPEDLPAGVGAATEGDSPRTAADSFGEPERLRADVLRAGEKLKRELQTADGTDDGQDKDLTAAGLAARLLEQRREPAEAAPFRRLLESLLAESLAPAGERALASALLLSRSLADESDTPHPQHASALALALDSPLSEHRYDSTSIMMVFEGDAVGIRGSAMHLAALLRTLFRPSLERDYDLWDYANSIEEAYHEVFPDFLPLQKVYNYLCKVCRENPGSFSAKAMRQLGAHESERRQLQELSRQATALKDRPNINANSGPIYQLVGSCFGHGSAIAEAMMTIVDNRSERAATVARFVAQFSESGEQAISDKRIDALFDDVTRQLELPHHNTWRLVDPMRRQLRAYRERLQLARQWLDIAQSDSGQQQVNTPDFASLHQEAGLQIKQALAQLENIPGAADRAILYHTLHDCQLILDDKSPTRGELFVSLTDTGIFALGRDGLPLVDQKLSQIRYHEPWRLALRHIVLQSDDARHMVLQSDGAGQTVSGPAATAPETTNAMLTAQQAAARQIADFRAELQRAFANGYITENERETHQYNLELCENLIQLDEPAVPVAPLIDALRQTVEDAHRQRRLDLLHDLGSRLEKGVQPEYLPVLQRAYDMVSAPEPNFILAEDYINRFDSGLMGSMDLDTSPTASFYLQFIEEDNFARLLPVAESWQQLLARRSQQQRTSLPRNVDGLQLGAEAKAWLQLLPAADRIRTANVESLLRQLGIEATHARLEEARGQLQHFRVAVNKPRLDMREYAHPISFMGTRMPDQIDVVFVFEQLEPQDLLERLRHFEKLRNPIVIMEGRLNLAQRRQLADHFHRVRRSLQSILLLDLVLMLHLAGLPQRERLPAFLASALAYTSVHQPFVDSGAVADEMFIGRRDELARILDPDGNIVLYGGRQLGKTALLRRARSLSHLPESQEYAVLIDALNIDSEALLVAAIVEELEAAGLEGLVPAGPQGTVATLDALCRLLKNTWKQHWSRIVLMIDEADRILEIFGRSEPAHRELQPLLGLRHDTQSHFRFVLAGLHNVCRSTRSPNSIFGQLGTSLAIGPLRARDAFELIARPLLFLGFRIEPAELEHILVATNNYPGIIHHIGHTLINNLISDYPHYYQANRGNPPFTLSRHQIDRILSENHLNDLVNERINMTIAVDPRYRLLASAVALLYHLEPEQRKLGYRTHEILDYAHILDEAEAARLSERECRDLLLELIGMGILIAPGDDHFRLRQRRFLDAIGPDVESIERSFQQTAGGEDSHV